MMSTINPTPAGGGGGGVRGGGSHLPPTPQPHVF